MNQWWFIINQSSSHKIKWNLNQNTFHFKHLEYLLQNVSHFFKPLTHWGLVTHICIRKLHHILVQIRACCLFGAKPLFEPMLAYCLLDHKKHISTKFYLKIEIAIWENALKIFICQMSAILTRPQCVNESSDDCLPCTSVIINTVLSLLEAPYLIEAPPNGSASCHKIVVPPQNRNAWRF